MFSVTGMNMSAVQAQVFAETAADTQATYAYVLAGADTINGTGADTLAGGAGNDVFYVDHTLDRVVEGAIVGVDRVPSSVNWTLGANVENLTLASGAFKAGTAPTDSSDRIVYDVATGRLFFDADATGAGVAILFATVAAHTVINASDFYVI